MKYTLIILFIVLTSCKSKQKEQPINDKDRVEATPFDEASVLSDKIKFNLLETVLKNLKLTKKQCQLNLVASKLNPINPGETIMVIPEIIKSGVDGDYFEFKSHILIANTLTGNVDYQYLENTKEDILVSDALELVEIKIDTAPYLVAASQRAFGVRLYYTNSSQPNPYSNEVISLYLTKNNSLLKILNTYEMMAYNGEWDTDCYGDFTKSKKVLIMSENKTNDYLNIIVNTKITEIKNRLDANDNCHTTEDVSNVKTILKFNNEVYK